jgi:hypothetical protein
MDIISESAREVLRFLNPGVVDSWRWFLISDSKSIQKSSVETKNSVTLPLIIDGFFNVNILKINSLI